MIGRIFVWGVNGFKDLEEGEVTFIVNQLWFYRRKECLKWVLKVE